MDVLTRHTLEQKLWKATVRRQRRERLDGRREIVTDGARGPMWRALQELADAELITLSLARDLKN